MLTVANLGDSVLLVCRDGKPYKMSEEHSPASERERIEAAGGFIYSYQKMEFSKVRSMMLHIPFYKERLLSTVRWQEVSEVNGKT